MGLNEDIQDIIAQERALTFPAFDENAAFEIGARLRERAVSSNRSLTIDIRTFSRQLFFSATTGATPENIDWVRRKFNTVRHFQKSSYRVGRETAAKGMSFTERTGLSLADYAAHGGSFPIHITGTGVIGAITVSGLPQRDDHELVVETLCTVLGKNYAHLALEPET